MRMLWLMAAMLTSMAVGSSGWAESRGRAKILRCSERNPQRCEIAVRGVPGQGRLQQNRPLEFYQGGKLVYRASEYRATGRRYKKSSPIIITDGSWQTSPSRRERILSQGRVLTVELGGREDLDLAFGARHDELADDERTDGDKRASDKSKDPDAAKESGTLEKLESWAQGEDEAEHQRVVASLKLGTPNSPTAMRGLAFDLFLLSPVLPLTVGFGDYDSERFIERKYGRIRYNSISFGSSLLIGKGPVRFKAGLSYTDIKVTSKAGEEASLIKTAKRNYTGLSPAIGLYGLSEGGFAMSLDYGHFVPLSGRYAKDFGAPMSRNDASEPYRNRGQFVSIGLGLGF
jgi:hypothetical protein